MARRRLIIEDELLTAQEAADFLNITRMWLYRLRKRGDGPPVTRVGGANGRKILFRKSTLLEWLEDRESIEGPKAA